MTVVPLKKVLYAEDDQDIQILVKLCLEQAGRFDLKLCSDGDEALKTLAEFQPQMVLLDAIMPKKDGIEVLREMRKNKEFDAIPVVFLTGTVNAHELEEIVNTGATEVINKPFDPITLPIRLKEIWEREYGK